MSKSAATVDVQELIERAKRTEEGTRAFSRKNPELAGIENRSQLLSEVGIGVPPSHFNPTDLGNAERLAARHGSELRYCAPWRAWMRWDGTRWTRDRDGVAVRLAKETVREIYAEASRIEDGAPRRALVKHAVGSESHKRIAAMLELAKTDARIAILPERFDDPGTRYLFNVQNGTVDLRTGTLRPHRPEDAISKLAPVTFDPLARSELWERFLRDVIPNDDVRLFLRRFMGSALTGDTGDESFVLLHGTGANGKTTLIETLFGLLGDYAHQASFETFLEATGRSDRRGAPRSDLLALRGVRLVAAVEAGSGRRLDETVIKQLTGGDTITARGVYHESDTSFPPEAKLCLAANHRPEIRGGDEAIWRRVLEVPFQVTIPESARDPRLKSKLREPSELSGVLNWALEGCRDWISAPTDRLRPPPAVTAATRRYREDQDRVRSFISDRCVIDAEAWVSSKDLRKAYVEWCESNGETPLSSRDFGPKLEAVGMTKERRGRGTELARGWRGLRLIDLFEEVRGDNGDAGDTILSQLPLNSPSRGEFVENGVSSVNTRSGKAGERLA